MRKYKSIASLVSEIGHIPGVERVYVGGSVLSSRHPRDVDIIVNWCGKPGGEIELVEKYDPYDRDKSTPRALVKVRGKYYPVDLVIHSIGSTNSPDYFIDTIIADQGNRLKRLK